MLLSPKSDHAEVYSHSYLKNGYSVAEHLRLKEDGRMNKETSDISIQNHLACSLKLNTGTSYPVIIADILSRFEMECSWDSVWQS